MNLDVDSSNKYYWKPNIEGIEKSLQNLEGFEQFERNFPGNVSFIVGGLSKVVKNEHHPTIRRLFPESEVHIVKEAGHWVQAQKPQEVIDLLLNLLEKD
jgi:pimeloyl-ACP methyl ester carboxylesterase